MGDVEAARAQLRHRIVARRAEVVRYVRSVRPWSNRLGTVSVISSGLVAVATAGPALGSESFTSSIASVLGLRSDLPVWQVACLVALVVSLVSTLSSALLRRQDVAARVAAAESASIELSALATAVEFGQVEIGEAVTRFGQITATVPFVDEGDPGVDPEPTPVVPAPRGPGAPQPYAGPYGAGREAPVPAPGGHLTGPHARAAVPSRPGPGARGPSQPWPRRPLRGRGPRG